MRPHPDTNLKSDDQITMRADVEAGIKEQDAGMGIPHDEVFDKLLYFRVFSIGLTGFRVR